MFDQKFKVLTSPLKAMCKLCGDACNDAILMLQFLEVAQQHILGVVGNPYSVLRQFNRLSSSENFENRLRFHEIIVTIEWRVFETQCIVYGVSLAWTMSSLPLPLITALNSLQQDTCLLYSQQSEGDRIPPSVITRS